MCAKRSESSQDFIPVKNIRHGIIETVDDRYLIILEIEPINFMLRSDEEQLAIISSFANWLKISPMRLQLKSVTRKADSAKHIAILREEIRRENNPRCRELSEGYISLISSYKKIFLDFPIRRLSEKQRLFKNIRNALHCRADGKSVLYPVRKLNSATAGSR